MKTSSTIQSTTSVRIARRLLGAMFACGLLFGCTVGPNYHQPPSHAKAAWASPMHGGETAAGPIKMTWWTTFHDTELNRLIARAAKTNLTLRIAQARILEARAQRDIVSGGDGPHIGALGSYSRNRFSKNGFPPLPPTVPLDYNLYRAGFDASWELDLFGGTRRAVESANANLAATEFGRADVLRSLLGEVAGNYIKARTFQQRLAITRANIKTQKQILQLTQDRFRAGLTSDLDVQQATAELASTQSQIPSLEAGFRNTTYRLDVLLGRQPGFAIGQLMKIEPIPHAPPRVPVGLPSQLLLRRPDVRRAERQLASATARIGVATSDLFPKFALTGAAGLQSVSASDWWTGGSRFWSAGPIVTWRLFDAGRIRANIRLQNARQEEALAQYEQTVLAAFEDVESSLTAYAKEQIRRQLLKQSVDANEQALKLARDLYRKGLTDFVRVLTSQRSLYLAQDALVRSDQNVDLDLVSLYKALGGGWTSNGLTMNGKTTQAAKPAS